MRKVCKETMMVDLVFRKNVLLAKGAGTLKGRCSRRVCCVLLAFIANVTLLKALVGRLAKVLWNIVGATSNATLPCTYEPKGTHVIPPSNAQQELAFHPLKKA